MSYFVFIGEYTVIKREPDIQISDYFTEYVNSGLCWIYIAPS